MGNRLVCICNMVSEDEIKKALEKGAIDTLDIQYTTKAGTSCGKCLVAIDHLVDDFFTKNPQDPQGRLNF